MERVMTANKYRYKNNLLRFFLIVVKTINGKNKARYKLKKISQNEKKSSTIKLMK